MRTMKDAIATVVLCALLQCLANAQSTVGEVEFGNSGAKTAQADFLYGLAQLHNFEYEDAAKAFRRAEAKDPDFAMAYWGEAMTFNHPVWNQRDRAAAMAALGKLGPTEEARLSKAPTDRERDYLSAVEVLYQDGPKKERDEAYAVAMDKLHKRYPDDVDGAAFYALALLGTTEAVRDVRVYMQAAGILMPLFYKYPHHPGVAHYLIHSCDDPVHAVLALPAARAYSKIAPNAAHAQHMTSHIFMALGMWDDVIVANENAMRVVNEEKLAAGKDPSDCGHYNFWLEYGYLEKGRVADARRLLEGCRREASAPGMAAKTLGVTDPDDAQVNSYLAMQARYVIDTAGWNSEVARESVDAGPGLLARWDETWLNGFAAARRGETEAAQRELEDLEAMLPAFPAEFDRSGEPPESPERKVPEIQRDQLKALILNAQGQADGAIALVQKAAELERALPYAFGPPDPAEPSYELLGELLMNHNRVPEAAGALQQALLRAPNRTQAREDLAKSATRQTITTTR
jgi:tetratricopeptide (TPR) repeat protein